jgi:hypothetical protein
MLDADKEGDEKVKKGEKRYIQYECYNNPEHLSLK